MNSSDKRREGDFPSEEARSAVVARLAQEMGIDADALFSTARPLRPSRERARVNDVEYEALQWALFFGHLASQALEDGLDRPTVCRLTMLFEKAVMPIANLRHMRVRIEEESASTPMRESRLAAILTSQHKVTERASAAFSTLQQQSAPYAFRAGRYVFGSVRFTAGVPMTFEDRARLETGIPSADAFALLHGYEDASAAWGALTAQYRPLTGDAALHIVALAATADAELRPHTTKPSKQEVALRRVWETGLAGALKDARRLNFLERSAEAGRLDERQVVDARRRLTDELACLADGDWRQAQATALRDPSRQSHRGIGR